MKKWIIGTGIMLAILLSGIQAQAKPSFADTITGEKIAVVVYTKGAVSEKFKRSALTRLENILLDLDVTVLDKSKTEELKDMFPKLEDPGAFITAEDFVENAEKFDIKALAAIYLTADVKKGLADYYTATANADIRFIDEQDGKVRAASTTPMGSTRGAPPSDGLTKSSALVNAIQRAVDEAAKKMGLDVMDPAQPRTVTISLQETTLPKGLKVPSRKPKNDSKLHKLVKLDKKSKWRRESFTCTAQSPDGGITAVGSYIKDTDMHRRPPRLYGSQVYVIDTKSGKKITEFECSPVEKKTREEKNTKQVLDVAFLNSWRFLATATGNHVQLWDTERGRELSKMVRYSKAPVLNFVRTDSGSYLLTGTGRKAKAYKIVKQ